MCLVSLESDIPGFSYMRKYYWKESKELTLESSFSREKNKARKHEFAERVA